MDPKRTLAEKREEILRICAKYGARNVRVFGSVARGESDENSDIDLLVEFEPGRSLLDHAGLWAELEELPELRAVIAAFLPPLEQFERELATGKQETGQER